MSMLLMPGKSPSKQPCASAKRERERELRRFENKHFCCQNPISRQQRKRRFRKNVKLVKKIVAGHVRHAVRF